MIRPPNLSHLRVSKKKSHDMHNHKRDKHINSRDDFGDLAKKVKVKASTYQVHNTNKFFN